MSSFDARADEATRSASSSRAVDVPTSCPACQSSSIVTTAKVPDRDSYWRCKDCGEVWNNSRSQSPHRGASQWR